MKLLTYDSGTGPRCGVLQGDSVVDVTVLLGEQRTVRDVGALLALDESSVDRVGDALAGGVAAPAVALDAVRLRSPILQPPTVRDFIVYEEHASSQGDPGAQRSMVPDAGVLLLQHPLHLRPRRHRSLPFYLGPVRLRNGDRGCYREERHRCRPDRCAVAHRGLLHLQRLERPGCPVR